MEVRWNMKSGLLLTTACCLCLAFVAQAETQLPTVEYLIGNRVRPLPFSDAVRVGPLLYLSGQLGTDDNFALVPGGIQAETKQALERIRHLLERHGSSLDHVVKCTVM